MKLCRQGEYIYPIDSNCGMFNMYAVQDQSHYKTCRHLNRWIRLQFEQYSRSKWFQGM